MKIAQNKAAIKTSFSNTLRIAKVLFEMSYSNWDKQNQPKFETGELVEVSGNLQQEYSTDSKVYNIVNSGAPPHTITAKPGKFMRFRDGFKAKTTPGVLTSFSQPPPSGDWHTKDKVNHPGMEGRNFSKSVVEQLEPTFARNMNEAVKVI